jgi:hypothetical protein
MWPLNLEGMEGKVSLRGSILLASHAAPGSQATQ